MRDRSGGFYRDGQGPDELARVIALFGPEDPDQAGETGQCGREGDAHTDHDHEQQAGGNGQADIDIIHHPFLPPVSRISSSNPDTVAASFAATVLASSISGTATGASVPVTMARP